MKKIFLLFLTVCLISCSDDPGKTGELTDFLPVNAGVIIQMQNPDLFFSNLRNNEFIKSNSENKSFRKLKEQLSILDYFPHNKEALLVLNAKEADSLDFTFITRNTLLPGNLDSISNKQVESIKTANGNIKRYILEEKKAFSTRIDSINILSNSRPILEKILSGETVNDNDLNTAFKAASRKKTSVLINHNRIPSFLKEILPPQFPAFSNWTVLDTDITQEKILLNGITVATDSLPRLVNVYKDVGAAQNSLAGITPVNADSFTSITFKDFKKLETNLAFLKRNTPDSLELSAAEVFRNSNEAGVISLSEGEVLAIEVLDPGSAKQSMNFEPEVVEEFRGNDIYSHPHPNAFQQLLEPLLNPKDLHFFTFLKGYVLFAESSESLKEMITSVQNDLVLANTEAYKTSSENLSSEASLLMVRNNQAGKVENDLDFTDYPLTAIQVIYQDNFAHIHSVLTKNTIVQTKGTTTQASGVKLGAALSSKPVFFRNHRTKGMDIAVQDIDNTLYLISPEGKIYWKKRLDSRILGDVQTVDILRNGRYQLAFATQNKLHIIDRDGNPVNPFPLKFRDDITQPLSVFDYGGKKDYRFVITQGNEVFMYDRKGRSVKGFTFSKTSSKITHPPKHIRIGSKDYIVIPEESGKLNILSRTGKTRVAVKENLDLTQNKWYEYQGNFISSNNSGQIINVTERGKISRNDLGLADNHRIVATEKTLVTLSDNELKIKGNSATLDFGLYTEPQIFYLNNKIYVSLTDLQANKVYLFDSNAALLPGFPVYGTSGIDLANTDKDPALELVVKGEKDEVLVYELQ
ncbi:hypothetical protein [Salinimicrobium sp. HB62]|uniref:hypothetical protein n=1 Tax=Salinimicrobium sp. HB62 TaxID=3077781 RepID=UPI002D77EF31|nr:hypothetical protein [Salinimicrobium sp. HB62]